MKVFKTKRISEMSTTSNKPGNTITKETFSVTLCPYSCDKASRRIFRSLDEDETMDTRITDTSSDARQVFTCNNNIFSTAIESTLKFL